MSQAAEKLEIPAFLKREPQTLGSQETRDLLTKMNAIDAQIKELQKEKAGYRRRYQSALGKLITAHLKEQTTKETE